MSRLFSAKSGLRAVVRDVSRQQNSTFTTTRSFSSFPLLRPSTSFSPTTSPIFSKRPTTMAASLLQPSNTTATTLSAENAIAAVADIVPKTSITSNPALCGLASQIRCGPRRHMNMNRPSRLIRKRRSGFLNRLRSKTGRKILKRRLAKGRKRLSA